MTEHPATTPAVMLCESKAVNIETELIIIPTCTYKEQGVHGN